MDAKGFPRVSSGSGFNTLVPSFVKLQQENRELRSAIAAAYPAPEMNYFDAMKLKEIADTEKLRNVLTLTRILFPGGIDRHGNAMNNIDKVLRMHNGALRDFIAAGEYIEDSYLGFHYALELREKVSKEFQTNVSNEESIPNFSQHLKVDTFIRSLPDGFYDYWDREGLARVVNENPDGTDKIIEYVRAHDYDLIGYGSGVYEKPLYSEVELEALFIHNALDEGVL
jgi:hypothetical protein